MFDFYFDNAYPTNLAFYYLSSLCFSFSVSFNTDSYHGFFFFFVSRLFVVDCFFSFNVSGFLAIV